MRQNYVRPSVTAWLLACPESDTLTGNAGIAVVIILRFCPWNLTTVTVRYRWHADLEVVIHRLVGAFDL